MKREEFIRDSEVKDDLLAFNADELILSVLDLCEEADEAFSDDDFFKNSDWGSL